MTHYSERFTVIPAVYVILRRDDNILLIRRYNTGYRDGFYSMPSGHLDGGEPAHIAAVREAKEEVGVTIDPQDLQFVTVMHRRAEEGNHERVDFVFEAHTWSGEPFNAEPDKCDDLQWFPLNELPENIAPTVREMLENLRLGTVYSSHNF